MDLTFITVVTGDIYFASEIEIFCTNLRKYGYSKNLQVLVDSSTITRFQPYWDKLQEFFKEVSFFFYNTEEIRNLRTVYPPIMRPLILKKHFKLYPYLEKNAIFYCDSDIVFTKYLDFTPFLDDNICYLSDTNSYISSTYFESKIKQVLPTKLEKYKKIDVLDQACKIVGISKDVAIQNKNNSGGAQYLLKGIDWKFWEKVGNDSIAIRLLLQNDINRHYFASEADGFQSWCADMWSVLWNLWLQGKQTTCPSELDFSWATNKMDRWYETYIYHNAGVTTDTIIVDGETLKVFNKVQPDFRNLTRTPFNISLNGYSNKLAAYNYVEEIKSIKNPICKII